MPLITACFFLSGFAGLVYEVVWARQLGLFLGMTSYAHTAVITAYMAGLAGGSLYFGQRADGVAQPLKTYAWLEIWVGIYAALTPWLFTLLQNFYLGAGWVSHIGNTSEQLLRFSIALLAVLAPAFLMGGTLPLMVRGFISGLPELGKVTSKLYGINTLGAMSGALLTGFLLLPRMGISASIFVAVTINFSIAIIVLILLQQRRMAGTTREQHGHTAGAASDTALKDFQAGRRSMLLIGFGLAGFAALLSQMAWIRALILVVGGSVYAFTTTLASFLAGIGLGSLLYSRYLAKSGDLPSHSSLRKRMVFVALLAFLISLSLLLGLSMIGKMPGWFLSAYDAGLHKQFPLFQLFTFGLSFSLMIFPTLLMGILFPLVTVIWTRTFARAGSGVGTAYAINTSGAILGASLGGLFLLPWLGIHHSIQLAAGCYFLVATLFWFNTPGRGGRFRRIAICSVAAIALLAISWSIPPWNRTLMMSGVFQTPGSMLAELPGSSLEQVVDRNELPYYAEGRDGIVAIRSRGNSRSLVINGKSDASSHDDLPTQVLLAQLPLALDRALESALVIGLGSGITAGSLATSTSLQQLRIIEISREVVEASDFFKPENYAVLDDPRTELVTADARNFLLASDDHYDLIVSEPSNPWLTGVANLFTDEFLKLAKSRLEPGGVMTQWFHTYSMSNTDLRIMLRTFEENFRYVSVWAPLFDDLIVIGSEEPIALSLEHALGREAASRAFELQRGRVNDFLDLVRLYLIGGERLHQYVDGYPINSDDHPVIEFSAPRNLYADTTRQNLESIFEFLQGQASPVPVSGMVRQKSDYIDARFINLRIKHSKDGAPGDLKPEWTVTQRLIQEGGNKVYGTIGSERTLDWQEGPASFKVRAERRSSAWTADERQLIAAGGTDTARLIRLPGDIEAVGRSILDGSRSTVQLEIAWQCAAGAMGFTHYTLSARLPASGEANHAELLDKQAARLHCY